MRAALKFILFAVSIAIIIYAPAIIRERVSSIPDMPHSSATATTTSPIREKTSATSTIQVITDTSSAPTSTKKTIAPDTVVLPKESSPEATKQASSTEQLVSRLENPYTTDPVSFSDINTEARSALVNIFCQPQGGSIRSISGSGVIIDPRGIILTNAHVAQYVLLSESPMVDLSCTIRTGSPARSSYVAGVLYISPLWVREHASDISTQRPMGTGEHDYALLYITGSATASPLPSSFPSLSIDTRKNVAFQGDQILAAGYPAELVGGLATINDLYAMTSVTTIKQMVTFGTTSVDALSLGGVIEAQSGSSGGAVVNAWGKLVGILSTMTDGSTTDERDLRAITLSYINRDMASVSSETLEQKLSGDPKAQIEEFSAGDGRALMRQYLDILKNR